MGLKNYTTEISVMKTVGEIQGILMENGAKQILTDCENGHVKNISFVFNLYGKDVGIRLPAEVEAVYKIMLEQKKNGEIKTKVDNEQAARTAWRNIKDWLEAQFTLIKVNQAKVLQIFLPYTISPDGRTFFEMYEQKMLTSVNEE